MVRYIRDEEVIAHAIRNTRRSVRDAQRPTGTETRRTADVADAALDLAEGVAAAPALSALVPATPSGVAVSANTGAWGSAGPVASVTVEWPAVTVATNSEPLTVTEYEVLVDGAPTQRLPGLSAVLTIPSGRDCAIRVVAISAAGVRSDPSAVVNATGASPEAATRAPSAPALTTGAGMVIARWDGNYMSGGTSGAHTVTVERQEGAVWVREGAALTGSGSVTIRGTVGAEMTVRLRAYDQLGRLTGTSSAATVTVAGVGSLDLDAGVTGVLDELGAGVGEALGAAAAADTRIDVEVMPAISDAAASPITDSRLTEGSLTVWPFQANTIPAGALEPGAVRSSDIADFAITAKKFSTNRLHFMY